MGFLETLVGKKKMLYFEILFGERNNVGVNVTKDVPVIPPPDYIRLWACYEAKIIYNLGFPKNLGATMAVGSIAKVVENAIDQNTDCFKQANVDDVIRFSPSISKCNIKFTGEFYARGSLHRTIKTWFPLKSTEQQVVYSGLALMQYAISMSRSDRECLEVFTKTARNMVKLYECGTSIGVTSIVQIPTLAYMQAIGVAE